VGEEIQVQGMPRPVATDSASVALNLAPVARRFRGSGQLHDVLDEAELATSAESFLVLGEPGSGKTTTLKRLTLTLFEESSLSTGNSELSMPVVVVCRQVDWTLTDLAVEVIRRVGVDPASCARNWVSATIERCSLQRNFLITSPASS